MGSPKGLPCWVVSVLCWSLKTSATSAMTDGTFLVRAQKAGKDAGAVTAFATLSLLTVGTGAHFALGKIQFATMWAFPN